VAQLPTHIPLQLLDSIAEANAQSGGQVVVTGSHGGASAAKFVLALPVPPRAVFFNDAGVGKAQAGIVALGLLDAVGIPAATYGHQTARIGDALDGYTHGVLTHVNPAAHALGVRVNAPVQQAVLELLPKPPGRV
jgi:hypothetical protein